MNARFLRFGLAATIATFVTAPAFSQATAVETRDVVQQQRIENGLRTGRLDTREAGRLEAGAARVDRIEANAGRDGSVSLREHARITAAQDRESRAIYDQKHDAQRGASSSSSPSSRRMQADVQRGVNQETRIASGVASGRLTTGEAARLDRGRARSDRAVARAASDGRIDAREQGRIEARDDHQSRRIYRKKHNGTVG